MPTASRAVLALLAVAGLALPAAARGQDGPCPLADLQPAADGLPAYERAVVCLINVERTTRDRGPLRADADLLQAARRLSADMVRRRYFAHVTPGGWDVVDRLRHAGYPMSAKDGWTVGEVLSWGVYWRSTPRATVDAWLDSAPHRAALLRPEFDEVGAGAVLGNPVRDDAPGVTVTVDLGHVG